MSQFFLTWFVSTIVFLLAAYVYRCLRLRRAARFEDLHWPGVVVLSLLAGLAPGIAVDNLSKKQVAVPEGVGQKPTIVEKSD
jgi:hypothetical protein